MDANALKIISKIDQLFHRGFVLPSIQYHGFDLRYMSIDCLVQPDYVTQLGTTSRDD